MHSIDITKSQYIPFKLVNMFHMFLQPICTCFIIIVGLFKHALNGNIWPLCHIRLSFQQFASRAQDFETVWDSSPKK